MAALMLIAHGSTTRPSAGLATMALAQALRQTGRFDRVEAAFLKQAPSPADMLAELAGTDVHAVPLFMERGRMTSNLLPALAGTALHAPIGIHPGMPALVRARAERLARDAGLAPEDAALLLVAHGSSASNDAGAEAIRAYLQPGPFAQTELVHLARAPILADWRSLIRHRAVVVQPLMMGSGTHLEVDLPAALSAAPGQTIVLGSALGDDPGLVDLVLGLSG